MKVDVCGQEYIINEIESSSRYDSTMGRSDSKLGIISVNKELPKDIKETTLIHEWLHCVLDNYSFSEESNDEKLVSAISLELFRAGFNLRIKNN